MTGAPTACFDAMGVSNKIAVGKPAALPEALGIGRREVQAIDDACNASATTPSSRG